MVDDALVACAERSYCHVVDGETLWGSCDGKESRSHRQENKINREGSVDLQVGHGPKIKLHENGPWDGVTAGLAMLSALHGLGPARAILLTS